MDDSQIKRGKGSEASIDRSVFFEIESDPILSQGKDAAQAANHPGVVRALDYVFHQAIDLRASDIHFEPCSMSCQLRYRIDGELRPLPSVPLPIGQALTSRVKILSGMDISQRRIPQDGRIMLKRQGLQIEFRVSTLPTVFGEGVVMRILNRSAMRLNLDAAGMDPDTQAKFMECVDKPNGIVLLTGPTGSGKTTTLYGAIGTLNRTDVKIITAEEPVEYDIDGVMQVEVNHDIGLNFARSLRAMLRQDPDIILVGEIRDQETAKIATEASMTGHLVLSTLHTRDAPSAVARLVDLGVEPYLVADTLIAVMAQRLVRTICDRCSEPDSEFEYPAGVDPKFFEPGQFKKGKGCRECGMTGFRGRTGLFELLLIDREVKELVEKNAASEVLREAARKQGLETLRACGFGKVGQGLTTLKEVWSATPETL